MVKDSLIKKILVEEFYGEKAIKSIQQVNQEFVDNAANDCDERNKYKKRTEVVLILLQDHTIIWDLEDHEEIKAPKLHRSYPVL